MASDCSNNEGNNNRVDFPSEMLLAIFSRLPADTLIRFRRVCKLWNYLIRDPYFIDLHQTKWMHKPPSRLILAPQTPVVSDSRRSLILVDGIKEGGWRTRQIPLDYLPNKSFRLYGSCNGLICMGPEGGWDSIFICNPITGERLRLPEVNLADKFMNPWFTPLYSSIGFGFDHATKKYKVLRLFCNHQLQLLLGKVITLGESSWRKLDGIPSLRELKIPATYHSRYTGVSPMLFLNGFFYGIEDEFILVFDIGSEKFGTLKICSPDHLGKYLKSGLGIIEGSLTLVIMFSASYSNGLKIVKTWRIVGSMAKGFRFEECSYDHPTFIDNMYAWLLEFGKTSAHFVAPFTGSEVRLMREPALFMPTLASLSDFY